MGEVTGIGGGVVALSIARLADEFGMARSTVSKRLAQARVPSAGLRGGYPVYRLRDAAPALLSCALDSDGEPDPRSLPPMQRNAWFQSELRRIDVGITSGQLIPASQHEADLAVLIKDFVNFLDTLPDRLEMEVGLSPEQVVRMQEEIDRRRQELYDRIVAEAGAEAKTNSSS